MASQRARQLRNVRYRARRRGLRADLSLAAWEKTLQDFEGRCAYCGGYGWTVDHFRPMGVGGGSTVGNCLPCCSYCNNQKGSLSPESFQRVSQERVSKERIEQVRRYLKRRAKGLPGWETAPVPQKKKPCITREKKEDFMPVQEIRKFKTVLPNGREILVSTTEAQIVLQVRQLPLREDDLLGPVIHVAAALTAAECVALASELLRAAAPLLEQAAAAPTVASTKEFF